MGDSFYVTYRCTCLRNFVKTMCSPNCFEQCIIALRTQTTVSRSLRKNTVNLCLNFIECPSTVHRIEGILVVTSHIYLLLNVMPVKGDNVSNVKKNKNNSKMLVLP